MSRNQLLAYIADSLQDAVSALASTFTTGDLKWRFSVSDVLVGWVPAKGGTLSKAGAGGSARAHADCAALFSHLWDNTNDAECPVSSGRGASGAADFAAGKTITLPDFRGRAPYGYDAAGITGRLTGFPGSIGDGAALGLGGGSEVHELVVSEMPSHAHAVEVWPSGFSGGGANSVLSTDSSPSGSVSGAATSAGGGGQHNNMPPGIIAGIVFVKL